jgi:hypothetical protein
MKAEAVPWASDWSKFHSAMMDALSPVLAPTEWVRRERRSIASPLLTSLMSRRSLMSLKLPCSFHRVQTAEILQRGNAGFQHDREAPLAVAHGKAVVIGVWVGRDLTRSMSMLLVGTPF